MASKNSPQRYYFRQAIHRLSNGTILLPCHSIRLELTNLPAMLPS